MSEPYENGGLLQPGATMAVNASGQPEPVIPGAQLDGDES